MAENEGPTEEQLRSATGMWWFVLRHNTPGVRCERDGKTWALQMPVTDGLVAMPQMMMCTSCSCAMEMAYSGPTPPPSLN